MIRYEMLLMTNPEITADEAAALEKSVEKILAEHEAGLISYERWGKYRLAYPVRAKEYGVYFLTRFETSQEKLSALLDALQSAMAVKYNELVMRFMTHRLDPHASLSYHRPESLEETPSRDIETFLKDNKMNGLMNNRGHKHQDNGDAFKGRHEVSEEDGLEIEEM